MNVRFGKLTRGQLSVAVTFVILMLGPLSRAAAVTFFDSSFVDGNWELVEIHNSSAAVVTSTIPTGGNPDAFRSIQNIGNAGDSATNGFQFRQGAVYDPGASGAIDHLEYSEDSRFFANSGATASQFQLFAMAVRQNDNIFASIRTPLVGHGLTNTALDTWVTHSFSHIVASDFKMLEFNSSTSRWDFVNVGPDFSQSASPLQFGFLRANSAGGAGLYSITAGIDNWTVTVVPEAPTSAIPHAVRVVGVSPSDSASPFDDPSLTLFAPDSMPGTANPRGLFSLGRFGSIDLELGMPISDLPGPDFVVWEESTFVTGGVPDESAQVFISDDGITYVLAGTVLDGDRSSMFIDIAGLGLANPQFVRIVDVSGESNPGGASGFDVDAITVLSAAGAVPEPSSAIAILVGTVCLSLRRRSGALSQNSVSVSRRLARSSAP